MVNNGWKLILVGCTLTACGDSESTKDVAYYLKHREERVKKLAQCQNERNKLKETLHCQNAQEAQAQDLFNPENTEMPRIQSKRFGYLSGQKKSTPSPDHP